MEIYCSYFSWWSRERWEQPFASHNYNVHVLRILKRQFRFVYLILAVDMYLEKIQILGLFGLPLK